MSHKHAALMLEYAYDAAKYDEPWRYWEYNNHHGWHECSASPLWHIAYDYRRKPRTININDHEVPEPMRVKPKIGEDYVYPDFGDDEMYGCYKWRNDKVDINYFNNGLCHTTKEAAIAHAKALLSFTEVKEE